MANLTREEIRKVFEYLEDENYEAIFEIIHDPILLVDPYEITDEQGDKILELISSKISILLISNQTPFVDCLLPLPNSLITFPS